ncbi:hypothetical protein BO71DRAFT_282464, partial [Aspergillus ellipticus CBS 707.79]
QQLFDQIKQDILKTPGVGYLQYTGIAGKTGHEVAKRLSEERPRKSAQASYNCLDCTLTVKLPTNFQGSIISWMYLELPRAVSDGFLTLDETSELPVRGAARFRKFPAPWQNMFREPTACMIPDAASMPTVVYETGWAEPYEELLQDKSPPSTGNQVKGYLEVWRNGGPAP